MPYTVSISYVANDGNKYSSSYIAFKEKLFAKIGTLYSSIESIKRIKDKNTKNKNTLYELNIIKDGIKIYTNHSSLLNFKLPKNETNKNKTK